MTKKVIGGKLCTSCDETKPRDQFHRRSRKTGDGLASRCKPCCAAYQKVYNAQKAIDNDSGEAVRNHYQEVELARGNYLKRYRSVLLTMSA